MKLNRILSRLLMGLAAAVMLASCSGLIYDGEGDCDPVYKVRFLFTKHLKSTDPDVEVDAFAAEVRAVTLYLVDEATGQIVWSKTEDGEAVRKPGYMMEVQAKPGRYHLVAWCGEGVGTDFNVADAALASGLSCHLVHSGNSRAGDYSVDRDLRRLYHGRLMGQVFPETEGTHVYDVSLTKDTNDVNVVLQQLSGEPIEPGMFSFFITDSNHSLDWTNAIASAEGETITYRAHSVSGGSAEIEVPDHPVSALNACVAELAVSRLVKGQNCTLTVVNNRTGEKVFSIPLIDYALLVKGRYKYLDDQEYLDRQDKYDLVFFLDEGYRWMNAYIYINSWQLVLNNIDV